jgi:subtilisin family serine protease
MAQEKNIPLEPKMLNKESIRKLNYSMRKLLEMSDADNRRLFNRDKNRITRERRKIDEAISRVPPTASESDKAAMLRSLQSRRAELMPHRDLIAIIPVRYRPIRIRAITRFTGNRSDLEDMGIEVRSQAQDVFTVIGTRAQLINLVNRPSCRSLRTPRMIFPTVEEASAQAEIAAIHDPRAVNPTGFEGNGVLVGIIDSPLDVTHQGFQDPTDPGNHDSRVLYYWAQSTHTQGVDAVGNPTTITQANPPGQTPEQFTNAAPPGTLRANFIGLNYGRLYTNAYINTAIDLPNPYGTGNNQICCEPTKDDEHGTHCAGIAAGSGHVTNWSTNPVHVGAAPAATIIHVRLERITQTDLDLGATFEDSLLDGIDFCMRAAQFHNMPIVISVSQGSNWGPHNGSSDFDLARDNFLNSFDNRSIVFAAGNDDAADGFRKGVVLSGNSIDNFTLTVARTGAMGGVIQTPVWLDIWYSGPELDFRITFGGNISAWRTAGQDFNGIIAGRNIEAERDMEAGGGLRGIRFYIANSRTNEVYTIGLRNPHATQSVDYYAWSGLQGWWADLSGATHHETTLSDTACGKSILTVGACDKVRPPNPATGETITLYSGAGPTVDGRIKPEIVTVGGTANDPATPANEYDPIWSAASDQNNGYTDMIGTSMATPLVAGAVALLFEEYGSAPPVGLGLNLNQDTIKALLTQYANTQNLHLNPTQAGFVAEEQNLYGYGRLRMIGPIDHLHPPVDNDIWLRTADDDYGEEPYPGGCFCHAPDIRVFQAGTNNETTQIHWGSTYDVRVTVRNLGDQDAVNTTLRLKYTLPHAAPNNWVAAEDAANNALENTAVNVPAMDSVQVVFHWRPEAVELNAPAGTTHFCLLAELDHINDPLIYSAPGVGGGSAWSTNIKGTNNVALRNLHIE